MSTKKLAARDVLLFYPNLIGYARILTFVGDVVDGHVARAFKQSSTFGGVLDMVTDRVSTCGLLAVLAKLYPEVSFLFISLIAIDIFSHWFHVMSVSGHHKSKDSLVNRNSLLQWYYSIYPLFGYCCVGTELFYILLYVLHFHPDPSIELLCYYGCLPACVLKQLVNLVQFSSACEVIATADAEAANKASK